MGTRVLIVAGLVTSCFLLATPAVFALPVTHGIDPVAGTGGPDGWSGITVLSDAIDLGGVGQADTVNYWAVRGDGGHRITPLLLANSAGVATIIGIGTEHTALANGAQSIPFGLTSGTDLIDTNTAGVTYHIGVLQQRDDVDDDEGGTIPFDGDGGNGMFQGNTVGPNHVPLIGDVVPPTHASGAGGRLYNYNTVFVNPIPEPATAILAIIGLIGLVGFVRRRRRGAKK